nr:peptidyl-prolyl cis-trans isomerase FKBP3-like [Globicephala melas]
MTECGEGKESPCSGKEVGVGEQKVEEEVGETRDKKCFLKYLMEGEMEKGETIKVDQRSVRRRRPKYTKSVLKKGDKTNFPKKGDIVHCWYTGTLQDWTVFDTNFETTSKKKKNAKLLSFKVGIDKVIRGWNEALLAMSKVEKARLEIEPEWAYGKKGQLDAKIPPNAKLIFEVELVDID